ncbi:MAG TPA: class I SAM-dependent methyltransferase [Burkholderiales bacterium]|nr:class I SAM-dependent methyltransferase [Burkholderiales bacterium]
MERGEIRRQWEGAASGWAKWEETIADWVAPATEAMLDMAGIVPGAQVLDLASGAGSQTLHAARRVGAAGHVVASDISETMLHHVRENARAARLENVSTLAGAAEELDVAPESFDAVTCRLGLMLFAEPAKALAAAKRTLKPGGKVAVVVVTTPAANPFLAKPMQILLQRAGKAPPAAGKPGLFALGAPGVLERLLADSGFERVEQRTVAQPLQLPTTADVISMMQDAFGAYRAVVSDCSEAVRKAAWAEVAEALKRFETAAGFEGPAELLVAAGVKPS